MKSNKTIAFLPIRKGSKSIPFKNFNLIAGKPLFCWVGEAVINCSEIDELIISTDNKDIKSVAKDFFNSPKVTLFFRSEESATDTASTESAIFDYLDREKPEFSTFILIQATCPFTTSNDLSQAIRKFNDTKADSLLTLIGQKKFFWEIQQNLQFVEPLNYSPLQRPMRQAMEFQYFENGAFYITKKESLMKSKCRISGKITYYVMDDNAMIDIDELSDWLIAEELLLRIK